MELQSDEWLNIIDQVSPGNLEMELPFLSVDFNSFQSSNA